MKENRFSVAPSKTGMNKFQPSNIKGNYNSNPSNNLNELKSRKSTNHMISYRGTTFSSINKSADPRPIKDMSFQEESIKKIIDFLIKHNYDRILTKKDLMSPQAKDFNNLFCFILNKIRPDWNIVINTEDIIPILNELRYPGFLNKSHLVAVGAPNTWPHLLAVLAWLVELAEYLYYDSVLDSEEEQHYLNEDKECDTFNSNYNITNVEKVFEKNYKEFLHEGFKQMINKGDNFIALESFQKKVDDMIKINYTSADKFMNDSKNLEKLSEDLEINNPSLIETQLSYDRVNGELNLLKSNMNALEKKLNEINNILDNKIKVYDSKCEKNKETLRMNEELDNIIKTQKVSYDEFEKLKHNKIQLEKQIQTLTQKKTDLDNNLWNINNNLEEIVLNLNSKIKNIKQIAEKINLSSDEINLIDIGSYISMNNILQLNLNEVNQNFSEINSQLASFINYKIKETKEKEEYHIGLKSELLKIDDKINESNEFMVHKNSENERINNTLALDKEKYIQICLQKNEEIKKINENCQKSLNSILEKEKELEEAKSNEVILDMRYREEEDMTDRFIKDLENEYVETFKQAERIKLENITEIRKTQKSLLKLFENIKNAMNE